MQAVGCEPFPCFLSGHFPAERKVFMHYDLKILSSKLNEAASIISQVLRIDVEIADADLMRIAATGKLKKLVNKSMENEGEAYRNTLLTGKPTIIKTPKEDPVCQKCLNRQSCKEEFEIAYPIKAGQTVVGVIGLLCFSRKKKERLLANLKSYSAFLKKIADFIALDLTSTTDSYQKLLASEIINDIQNSTSLGMLAIDGKGGVSLLNAAAEALLPAVLRREETVNILPASAQGGNPLAYIMEIGKKQLYVTGKLYHIGMQRLDKLLLFTSSVPIPGSSVRQVKKYGAGRLSGHSPAVKALKAAIREIPHQYHVYLQSAPGLDIDEVVTAVFEEGGVERKKLYWLNCAAFSPQELSSILFPESGAFLEKVSGNALYLANIDKLTPEMQERLYDVIRQGHVQKPASQRSKAVNIRILSSCETGLYPLVQQGAFHLGLFYLLSPATIQIPLLCEMGRDIPALLKNEILSNRHPLAPKNISFSEGLTAALTSYDWPGNHAQLKHLGQILAAMEREVYELSDLPGYLAEAMGSGQTSDKPEEMAQIEALFQQYGRSLQGKQQVAEALGISIATLYRRISKYQL